MKTLTNNEYEPQSKPWERFAASCRVLYPPLRGIVKLSNSSALHFRNWSLTNKNQAGFTLIEAIAVLVIVGILAVGLSMGLVKGVQDYIFASEATQLSQKAQVALARIDKELIDVTAITSWSATQVDYTRPYSPPSCQQSAGCQYRIQMLNNQILLGIGPTYSMQVLIDNVAAYPAGSNFLAFKNISGADWSLETGSTVNNLAQINVLLILTYGSNQTLTFNTSINPRQGSNLNAPKLN
jgi:prepilin-type N-terminal cleavage/methylation domain-containing protein